MDGKTIDTPISPSPGLKIYERRHHIYLKTDFGLSVKFDGQDSAGNETSTLKRAQWNLMKSALGVNFYGLISFPQRLHCHACTEERLGVCAGTLTDKAEMTGWSQTAAGPGAWRSLQRAGECKHPSDVKKRHNLGFFLLCKWNRDFRKSLSNDNLLYQIDKKDLLLDCSGILQ